MSEKNVDLIVIGGGPGGYVAAIRAAQLGQSVAVVEERERLGGVCLNEGCIPSKALLDASEHFSMAQKKFSSMGIEIDPPRLNLSTMMERKDKVIDTLSGGIDTLLKKNKIERVLGRGKLLTKTDNKQQVEVTGKDGTEIISATRVLLATGSQAIELPDLPFSDERIVHARGALDFSEVPEHLLVVGGGYIGLELGSVWCRLGAQVTVVDLLPNLLPTMDGQMAKTLQKILKKQGLKFQLDTKITSVDRNGKTLKVELEGPKGSTTLDCDRILVAAGRRPLTADLGLEELGVQLTDRGRVQVNDDFETSVSGIYAIGDLIDGPMLAHKASDEGVVFAERLDGQPAEMEYDLIPGVVYTWPEGASVGLTEEQLKEQGTDYVIGHFSFAANGRARCMDETEGFVKLLAAKETGRVLGAHILGPQASVLIAEAAAVMNFGGSVQDIELTIHAHPTLAEAIKEAALAAQKRAIHG